MKFEFFIIYILTEALLNRQNSSKGEMRVLALMLILSIGAFYYAKYYTRYAVALGAWKDLLGFFSFVKISVALFHLIGYNIDSCHRTEDVRGTIHMKERRYH